jgi:hypothetical protein
MNGHDTHYPAARHVLFEALNHQQQSAIGGNGKHDPPLKQRPCRRPANEASSPSGQKHHRGRDGVSDP